MDHQDAQLKLDRRMRRSRRNEPARYSERRASHGLAEIAGKEAGAAG